MTEVKNVARQAFTQQLKDSLYYAKDTRRVFDLYVRSDIDLTGPLREAVAPGDIILKLIP